MLQPHWKLLFNFFSILMTSSSYPLGLLLLAACIPFIGTMVSAVPCDSPHSPTDYIYFSDLTLLCHRCYLPHSFHFSGWSLNYLDYTISIIFLALHSLLSALPVLTMQQLCCLLHLPCHIFCAIKFLMAINFGLLISDLSPSQLQDVWALFPTGSRIH